MSLTVLNTVLSQEETTEMLTKVVEQLRDKLGCHSIPFRVKGAFTPRGEPAKLKCIMLYPDELTNKDGFYTVLVDNHKGTLQTNVGNAGQLLHWKYDARWEQNLKAYTTNAGAPVYLVNYEDLEKVDINKVVPAPDFSDAIVREKKLTSKEGQLKSQVVPTKVTPSDKLDTIKELLQNIAASNTIMKEISIDVLYSKKHKTKTKRSHKKIAKKTTKRKKTSK